MPHPVLCGKEVIDKRPNLETQLSDGCATILHHHCVLEGASLASLFGDAERGGQGIAAYLK